MRTLLQGGNEHFIIYGICCLFAGIACFFLSRRSALTVNGVSAWIKPLKFFLSIAVLSLTFAFYVPLLRYTDEVEIYSWSFIILMTLEVMLITLQAARGRESHFNTSTVGDNVIFGLMGIAIVGVLVHTIYITCLFFIQERSIVSSAMVLAIRLSLLIMILFAFEGFVMIRYFSNTIGEKKNTRGIPLVQWSRNSGDLRVAHFFGIHAVQVIPLICYFSGAGKPAVIVISTAYFLLVTFTFIQAIKGKPLLRSR